MDKLNKWLTPVNTILIAGLLFVVLVGGNQSASFGATGTRFPNGISADSTSPVAGELRGTTLTLTSNAAVSGTSIAVGGITYTTSKATMTSGTSTPCAIASPAATTTLLLFTFKQTTATSSAVYWDFATSTTAYATTSVFASRTALASTQNTYSVVGGREQDSIVSPSTYVVAKAGGSNTTNNLITIAGTCTAVFVDSE